MPIYRNFNDAIEGDKIYCTFERCSKVIILDIGSRHRGQCQSIKGNPATAVILKKWRRIKLLVKGDDKK